MPFQKGNTLGTHNNHNTAPGTAASTKVLSDLRWMSKDGVAVRVPSLEQAARLAEGWDFGRVMNWNPGRPANPDRKKQRAPYDPQRQRNIVLRSKYKVSPEWYETKLQEQDGGCGICHGDNGERPFAVDHDHNCCSPFQKRQSAIKACGKCNRGLLCSVCNQRLGYFEQFLEALDESYELKANSWESRALQYLARYSAKELPDTTIEQPAQK